MLDRIALVISIIGALNWGTVGLFRFDFLAWVFGGPNATFTRVIYALVAIAGLWCVSLLFRHHEYVGVHD